MARLASATKVEALPSACAVRASGPASRPKVRAKKASNGPEPACCRS